MSVGAAHAHTAVKQKDPCLRHGVGGVLFGALLSLEGGRWQGGRRFRKGDRKYHIRADQNLIKQYGTSIHLRLIYGPCRSQLN